MPEVLKLVWDPFKEEFMVGDEPLRDFYIRTRLEAGISISKLARDAGVAHPLLHAIEAYRSDESGRPKSNSVRSILIALDTLGFNLELHG